MKIKVNNIELNYEIYGDGKPIIVLNPNDVNTNFMNPICKKLSENFKVYKVDRRCCGKSTRECILTYGESAKDIYEFIKKMNIDKPYILGASGGASVCLFLNVMFPNCVSKMVLCSGSARKINFKIREILKKLPWYPGKKDNDKFWKLIENSREITTNELNKIEIQTLVINGGKKDCVPLEEAKYISDNIKNSELVILEKEGHCTYMTKNNCFEKIRDFLL